MSVQYPPPWAWHYFAADLWKFIDRLRSTYYQVPFSATSWWRSYTGNLEAGGAEFSQHLIGTAADLWAEDLYKLERELRRQGLIAVRYSGHVHAQLWEAGKLERLLTGG